MSEPDHAEIDAIVNRLIDVLQPFAAAHPYAGQSAVSACVSVLCQLAEEQSDGGDTGAKYRVLAEVFDLLREQGEAWQVRDGLSVPPAVLLARRYDS